MLKPPTHKRTGAAHPFAPGTIERHPSARTPVRLRLLLAAALALLPWLLAALSQGEL